MKLASWFTVFLLKFSHSAAQKLISSFKRTWTFITVCKGARNWFYNKCNLVLPIWKPAFPNCQVPNETTASKIFSLDCDLPGSDDVWTYRCVSTFRRNILLPSSEDGGSMFVRNVAIYLQVHTALLLRRTTSTSSSPWQPNNIDIFIAVTTSTLDSADSG
jgi:hypothetical protein